MHQGGDVQNHGNYACRCGDDRACQIQARSLRSAAYFSASQASTKLRPGCGGSSSMPIICSRSPSAIPKGHAYSLWRTFSAPIFSIASRQRRWSAAVAMLPPIECRQSWLNAEASVSRGSIPSTRRHDRAFLGVAPDHAAARSAHLRPRRRHGESGAVGRDLIAPGCKA